uniref:Uncharacterized protein n=1 Tax=Arundo donax TaxID=35708 RepID=A0A0A9B2J5_ARUDO
MTATATSSTSPIPSAETGSMVNRGFARSPSSFRRGAGHGEKGHGASRASARSSAAIGEGAGGENTPAISTSENGPVRVYVAAIGE